MSGVPTPSLNRGGRAAVVPTIYRPPLGLLYWINRAELLGSEPWSPLMKQ